MKLRNIKIKGFRSIKEIELNIDDFLCFIGPNNHGKSNIFQALDLFFSSGTKKITPEIFFRSPSETIQEIIIEAHFENLTSAEMEKLKPWTSNGSLKIVKKYWIDEEIGKSQVSYEAIMKVPQENWLREEFENYNKRQIISQLPIAEFIPESGRITKPIYKNAIQEYINAHSEEIIWIDERRVNPAGFKTVLDGYLPEFYLVPAVSELSDETKTSGTSLLSRILGIIINRIASQNPEFKNLKKAVERIKVLIEGKSQEEKLIEIKEIEEKIKNELEIWNVELNIGVEAPEIEKIFQLGTYITLDDGIVTRAEEKGHGLQRSLIFALMRVWATEAVKVQGKEPEEIRERFHIFAFEEPELFLHPHMCKSTYDALKQISQSDQIMICTHSPHFIDMEDYQYITLVTKTSLEIGTKVQCVQRELFVGEKKKQFNMIRYFNPDRNEMFFATKVVLVEGATEKALIPLLAKRLGIFNHSISIIDCGGKFNLSLFMDVLNEFRIHYIVIHDEDPIDPELKPEGTKFNQDKYRKAKRIYKENEKIKDKCDSAIGLIKMIPGELEVLLGISKSQVKNFGKPFVAVQKYSNESESIPQELQEIIKEIYEFQKN